MTISGDLTPESRMNRPWAHWLDEYGTLSYLLAYIPLLVANHFLFPDDQGWWTWVLVAVVFLYMGACQFAADRHDRGMCPSCFESFPHDPGARATGRALPLLHLVHLMWAIATPVYRVVRHWPTARVVGPLLGFLAPMCTAALLLPRPWGLATGLAWLAVLLHATRTHQILDAYCPWCKDDGDDDDDPEAVPDPDPAPGKEVRA